MPTRSKRWRHVTVGTWNSWLPGDQRGFRSKGHQIHSSGHHRNPPPKEEHAGLRRYAKGISSKPVIIPRKLRPIIGRAIVAHFSKLGHRLLVVSVGGMHVHAQVELPRDYEEAKREVGRVKRIASCAVTAEMPGRIWERECGMEPIDNRGHQRNTYRYIRDHVKEGAWVWSEMEGEL